MLARHLALPLLAAASPAQSLVVELRDSAVVPGAATDQSGAPIAVAELSGITWLGGTRYAAIGDGAGKVVVLDLDLDADGSILSVAIESGLSLEHALDFEGIAWSGPAGGSAHLSEEGGPGVREYSLTTGGLLRVHPVPPVFTAPGNLVPNRGFESLSLRDDGARLVTANEEALTVDVGTGGAPGSTTVRLAVYAGSAGAFAPLVQHAYETAPVVAGNSALVDLVALPDGRLLALERALTLFGGFQSSIFELDTSGATDVGAGDLAGGLAGASYVPVAKTLLWGGQVPPAGQNLEGLCFGQPLLGGGRALVGVVDDGDPISQNTLVVFALHGDAGAPSGCGGPCPPATLSAAALPVPLGGILELDLASPAPSAPLVALVDTAPGPIAIAGLGNVMLGLSPALFFLAGGDAGPATTDGTGAWSLHLPVPVAPALLGLAFHLQAFVLDAGAENGTYHASNPLEVGFG